MALPICCQILGTKLYLGLEGLLAQVFRFERPESLAMSQASRVIEALEAGSDA